jgi:hypothetical protein
VLRHLQFDDLQQLLRDQVLPAELLSAELLPGAQLRVLPAGLHPQGVENQDRLREGPLHDVR